MTTFGGSVFWTFLFGYQKYHFWYPQNANFGRFGGIRNGTSSARIKKVQKKDPPKCGHPYETLGQVLEIGKYFWATLLFLMFFPCIFPCKLTLRFSQERVLKWKSWRKQTSLKIQFYSINCLKQHKNPKQLHMTRSTVYTVWGFENLVSERVFTFIFVNQQSHEFVSNIGNNHCYLVGVVIWKAKLVIYCQLSI